MGCLDMELVHHAGTDKTGPHSARQGRAGQHQTGLDKAQGTCRAMLRTRVFLVYIDTECLAMPSPASTFPVMSYSLVAGPLPIRVASFLQILSKDFAPQCFSGAS